MVKPMSNHLCAANSGKPIMFALAAMILIAMASAQNTSTAVESDVSANPQANAAPLTVTLQDAIARARKNSPEYRAALTAYGLAKEDRVQGRAALLPAVNYNAGFLYTQGNGTSTGRFIATNGVHEYLSQGNVHQDISLQGIADYRRTRAAEAVARARSEIAARGLVVTVVQAYYHFVVAKRKYATAQRAATQGQRFLDISQKLEKGGEVAHSDVIKAQIQFQQQQRDLQEAELEMNRSRLELAVLLFPDFNQNFTRGGRSANSRTAAFVAGSPGGGGPPESRNAGCHGRIAGGPAGSRRRLVWFFACAQAGLFLRH